jgi:3-hydroxyacyl-[acyl-carrier-protein] dehydratase
MSSLSFAVRESLLAAPEEVSPGVWEASFFFNENFLGFNGHFRGDPMLPGIAQIMAVTLTASAGHDSRLLAVRRAKFMDMVKPGDVMRVRATVKSENEHTLVTGDCATEKGPCAQIKLILDL